MRESGGLKDIEIDGMIIFMYVNKKFDVALKWFIVALD
jgi:hypothetical protein